MYALFPKRLLARRFPRPQEENKGLKGSQVKELCWKNWKKSPENPENQKPPGVPTGGYPAKSRGRTARAFCTGFQTASGSYFLWVTEGCSREPQ